jgi:hypothetical protein
MKEVVPEADGSIEDEIILLSSKRVFQILLQEGVHLSLPLFDFLDLGLGQLNSSLLLEERLEVFLVKLINFDLGHIEAAVSLGNDEFN